jgi:hypothetical protein
VTVNELLKAARDLTRYSDPTTGGRWPRAAALLGRQALERTLDQFWAKTARGVENCSAKAQFLCLRRYLGDEELAERAWFAWSALSRACHHHVYELAPTVDELTRWLEDVEAFVSATDFVARAPAEITRE